MTYKMHKIDSLIKEKTLLINDGYRAKNSELATVGQIPFARAGNIKDGFNFNNSDFFPLENISKVGNKISNVGDVVFTSKGTVGRFAYVKPGTTKFVYSPQLCFWRSQNDTILDSKWLFYWMQGGSFFEQYKGVSSQTDMAEYVSLQDQKKMRINIPPLPTQKAIAHILGTLDDKIELLRQMNETLEAMARALFKSWFVDFDPVRNKADGLSTGLPKEIEDLFPSEFEDSELGEIPKGWKVGKLGDYILISGGGTPKTSISEYWNGEILWFSVVDSPSLTDIWVIDTQKKITEEGLKNSSTKLLNEFATIISARGTVGNLALVGVPMCMNQSCYAIEWKKNEGNLYLFFLLRNTLQDLKNNSHGSVFDTITRDTFDTIKFVNPPIELITFYSNQIFSALLKIRKNLFEIKNLSSIRDTLLPKLISGELELSDEAISKILEPAK